MTREYMIWRADLDKNMQGALWQCKDGRSSSILQDSERSSKIFHDWDCILVNSHRSFNIVVEIAISINIFLDDQSSYILQYLSQSQILAFVQMTISYNWAHYFSIIYQFLPDYGREDLSTPHQLQLQNDMPRPVLCWCWKPQAVFEISATDLPSPTPIHLAWEPIFETPTNQYIIPTTGTHHWTARQLGMFNHGLLWVNAPESSKFQILSGLLAIHNWYLLCTMLTTSHCPVHMLLYMGHRGVRDGYKCLLT